MDLIGLAADLLGFLVRDWRRWLLLFSGLVVVAMLVIRAEFG